jgi:amino acid transporter
MIGVGPFLTMPLILAAMGGPQAMLGWVLGSAIALCDGLVWAELGAAMPGSGGPFYYLREAFGPRSAGKMMSFLFLWGTVFIAPLSIASGAVGFSQYLGFAWRSMTPLEAKLIAVAVCLLSMLLLYRDTPAVGRLSLALGVVVIGTVLWIVFSGLTHFRAALAFDFPAGAFSPSLRFLEGLGAATLVAMYDFGGYSTVCLFGGEVRNPARTIPRSIILAVLIVGALFITMNISIIGVVPWKEAEKSSAIISDLMLKLYGPKVALVVTALILWTTFASIFALMLGNSRVPYAAAVERQFFEIFGRLHPIKRFPTFSLITLGLASAVACWFTLDELIKALMIFQILVQFLAQIVAVTLIRKYRPDIKRPFAMWLYPLPSLVAFGGWLFILFSNGVTYAIAGILLALAGIAAYLIRAFAARDWPFQA